MTGREVLQALGHTSTSVWKGRVRFTAADVFNQLIPVGGLSELMIRQLLENDVDDVVEQLESEFPLWESYSDVRKEVLVNVLFNLGIGTFRRFKKMNATLPNAGRRVTQRLQNLPASHDSGEQVSRLKKRHALVGEITTHTNGQLANRIKIRLGTHALVTLECEI